MDPRRKLTIRSAVSSDRDALAVLAQAFLSSSPLTAAADHSPDRVAALVDHVRSQPNSGVLVVDAGGELLGMLAYLIGLHPVTGLLTLFDIAWFMREDARGGPEAIELVNQTAHIGRLHGCVAFHIGAPNAAVLRFLVRAGFEARETTCVMELV